MWVTCSYLSCSWIDFTDIPDFSETTASLNTCQMTVRSPYQQNQYELWWIAMYYLMINGPINETACYKVLE